MAVSGVHSVPDDQPLKMWFEGMHSPGVADNSSKLVWLYNITPCFNLFAYI